MATEVKKARAESNRADLSNYSVLVSLTEKHKKRNGEPNPAWDKTWLDSNNKGFGLRISPLGLASWTWKFRGYDGKHVEGSIPFFLAPKVPKGEEPLDIEVPEGLYDYKMAVEHYQGIRTRARMTPEQRERADRTGLTLAEAVPKYLESKIKRKTQLNLSEETKEAYLGQWQWLEPLAGHWVLKNADSFQWQRMFEEVALKASIKREILRSVHEGVGAGNALAPQQKFAVIKRLERGLPTKWQEEDWWKILTKDEREGVENCLNSVTDSDIKILESSQVWQAANLVSGIYTYFADDNNQLFNPIKVMKGRWRVKPSERRIRVIPMLNMPGFWQALQNRKKVRVSKDCITVILLTGFRNSAARRMRWEQVDFERGVYVVRPGDIGWKGWVGDMPLSDYVLDLLRERRKADPHGQWVFPSHVLRSNGPLSRLGDSVKVCCKEMGLSRPEYYIPHDLRRGFSTVVKTVSTNDFSMVGALMGHKWAVDDKGELLRNAAVTFGYIQDPLEAKRYVANLAAQFILQVCKAAPMEPWVMAHLKKQQFKPEQFQADEDLPEPDSDDSDETKATESVAAD